MRFLLPLSPLFLQAVLPEEFVRPKSDKLLDNAAGIDPNTRRLVGLGTSLGDTSWVVLPEFGSVLEAVLLIAACRNAKSDRLLRLTRQAGSERVWKIRLYKGLRDVHHFINKRA
jgi:hypothetical protein